MSVEEWFRNGQSFLLDNDLENAQEVAEKLIKTYPDFQKGYQLMGYIAFQGGKLEEARHWLELFKDKTASDYIYLGNIAFQLHQFEEARAYYQKVRPENGRVLHNIGLSYYQEKNYAKAITYFRRSTFFLPEFFAANFYLAKSYQFSGHHFQALNILKKCIKLRPEHRDSYLSAAFLYQTQQDFQRAENFFKKSLALTPQDPEVIIHYLANQYLQGHLAEVIGQCRLYLEGKVEQDSVFQPMLERELPVIMSLLILCEYSLYGVSNHQLYQRVWQWGQRFSEHLSRPPLLIQQRRTRLRIGYLSQEFSFHSSSFLFRSLFKYCNKERFEVFVYADNSKHDIVTKEIKQQVEHWLDVKDLNDSELYKKMREDQIDILVDLGGHTHSRRLLFFALKPAPLQLTGLGFGLPSGLKAMDYFVGDPQFVPPELSSDCREKLFYLPSCLLHWEPPDVSIRPRQKQSHFVFGSGNAIYKLNQKVYETWAKILRRATDSQLWLKATAFSDSRHCQKVLEQFEALGVAADRIRFFGKTAHREHLEFYQQIDLILDPFPYGGGISTCEALWMEVPVLTLRNSRRVAVSILAHLNLHEFIASNSNEYVDMAVSLAQKPVEVLSLNLRERLMTSSICDGRLYTKTIEDLYRAIWNKELYRQLKS